MKLNLADYQDFSGKFILEGKISKKNLRVIKNYISENQRIKDDFFDVHIKETSKKNILMSLNKDFSPSYGIRNGNLTSIELDNTYLILANDADNRFQKCSVIDQLLCVFGIKKIV